MSKWICLSHFLDTNTPAYGGGETFQSVPVRSIERNDSCNAACWTLPNHIGTHIDCPRHFSLRGKTLSDYPAHFWIFRSAYLMKIAPINPQQQIDAATLSVESIHPDVDLLFIKTGFGQIRQDSAYWKSNPAFSSDLADALRKQCPRLRVMGFDTISLSSWSNRTLGRLAHKAFLDNFRPILLLEDMDLSRVESNTYFLQVIVSPLLVAQTDAASCTVLAEVDE